MQSRQSELLNRSEGVVVVCDSFGPNTLRTIPFFLESGFTSFTYPLSWRLVEQRSIDVYNYDFFLSSDAKTGIPNPLIVITTQYWESHFPLYSISILISKALNAKSKIIIVCDTPKYQMHGTHRPLIEEDFVRERLLNYRDLFIEFRQKSRKNFSFPLRDTMNIFMQKCAHLIKQTRGIDCRTVFELHKSILDAPENPLWWFWSNLFRSRSGFSIPIGIKESGLLNFIVKRAELSYRDIKWFIHELHGPSEKYLDPSVRQQLLKKLRSNAEIHTQIMQMMDVYGLRKDDNA